MREYREPDADNARWEGFEFRPGDIVIDAPSKSGTTWTQLLVALLIFDGPDFPAAIGEMSFWMEQTTRPVETAHAVFARQTHRRFIKSHTPLDGIPLHDDVRYVCVGRDPRDAAISMIHHGDNMDRERFAELIGAELPDRLQLTIGERIDRWLDGGPFPDWSARFLVDHLTTFWERRHLPNVELFHFADYLADLPAEVARLAEHLEIDLDPGRAEELAAEAGIDRVRSRAADVAPEAHLGVWKDTARFFRAGRAGEWREVLTPEQQSRYEAIVASLDDADLATWIHAGRT